MDLDVEMNIINERFKGQHIWEPMSHTRPTYCNFCREGLSTVTFNGMSCQICKFKCHTECAPRVKHICKWTTLASMGSNILEDNDRCLTMPHQWLEGNLPVSSARCTVCEKVCGSVMRLQDWRCIWCKIMTHERCKGKLKNVCGVVNQGWVVPPTALHSLCSEDMGDFISPISPLVVMVNIKSGNFQGQKFFQRFRQLLNPAQVFDLVESGPSIGLRLFKSFKQVRVLVCGGDGSVGWVLKEIDNFNLNSKCQVAVLPLGTGNDLARVLSWGSVCDDDSQIPHLLERYERAKVKLLDRWSILTYESPISRKLSQREDMINYEDSVVTHLSQILQSDQHPVILSSAKVLCQTVKDFIAKVGTACGKYNSDETHITQKCTNLNDKLDLLLSTLSSETEAANEDKFSEGDDKCVFIQKEALISRANSLKKAIHQIIEDAEKIVDEQNYSRLPSIAGGMSTEPSPSISPLHSIPSPSSSDNEQFSPSRRISMGSTVKYLSGFPIPFLQQRNPSFPIINPLVSFPSWPSQSHLISQALLANADALCAAASPLMDPDDIPMERFAERCVMNNYFGIGLDAKITLEFHNKREEHPEKYRSRAKNYLWYGVLGGKEFLHQTFKNLEQKIQLECDGRPIPLPSLQGLVVLNIPSYGGGANFWGTRKENDVFQPPAFDDKVLEVVAVFSTVQIAASRYISLQHHRIAQCHSLQITILGDEGMPVQVDGEAWLQPAGFIRISHKNRAQMLSRDKFAEMRLSVPCPLVEKEERLIHRFFELSSALVESVKEASLHQPLLNKELAPLVSRISWYFNRFIRQNDGQLEKISSRHHLSELVSCMQQLHAELKPLLSDLNNDMRSKDLSDQVSELNTILTQCIQTGDMAYFSIPPEHPPDEGKGLLKLLRRSIRGRPGMMLSSQAEVTQWDSRDVANWLDALQLSEYKDTFMSHDIQGTELLNLDRRDLKDLGIVKVGHIKRILQAAKDMASVSLSSSSSTSATNNADTP